MKHEQALKPPTDYIIDAFAKQWKNGGDLQDKFINACIELGINMDDDNNKKFFVELFTKVQSTIKK